MKREEKIAMLKNYRAYLIYYSNINKLDNEKKNNIADKPKVLVLKRKFGNREIPVA